MTEIRPILETYEQQLQTFQMSQTFGTLTNDNNELQPMITQQKAAIAQAALIKFLW